MALFSFRTRNPQRDRETDRARFDRLLNFFGRLLAETEAEYDGLKDRYDQTQASAAFALEAFENGDGEELSAKADDLTLAMQRYQARIAVLERQLDFMRSTAIETRAFYDGLAAAGPALEEDLASKNVAVTAHD